MSKIINYGIVGTGHLGNYHVQQILNIKHINLIGCYDINVDLSKKVGLKYKIKSFNSLNELLKACDAISIATPASYHYKVAEKALKYNCHLFIEKPITNNIKDALSLISLAKQQKKLIQVGHIERFSPAYKFLIKSKVKPKFIESHRLSPFNIRGTDVNVILDLMIHDIDLIINLMEGPIKNVFANGVSHLSSSIDLANVRLEFKNGGVANLTASRLSNSSMRKMRVFSQNRYYSLNFNKHMVETYNTTSLQSNVKLNNHNYVKDVFTSNNKIIQYYSNQLNATNALYEELDAFIKSIVNSSPVMVSAQDATLALKVALEIEKKISKI